MIQSSELQKNLWEEKNFTLSLLEKRGLLQSTFLMKESIC